MSTFIKVIIMMVLFCGQKFIVNAQDTTTIHNSLDEVTIYPDYVDKVVLFNTIQGNQQIEHHGDSTHLKYASSSSAIRYRSNERLQFDSVLVKIPFFDTNAVAVSVDVYKDNKKILGISVLPVTRKVKYQLLRFPPNHIVDRGEFYIAYHFRFKQSASLKYFVNRKKYGFLYSFDEDKNNFEILSGGDIPTNYPAPQVKLFCTKV